MNFQSLVLITTNKCNARCRMCYPSCGPHRNDGQISVEEACGYIDQAADLPEVKKQLALAGGEVFLYYKDLRQMVAHGARRGFGVSITTNAFWGHTLDKARRMVADLQQVGLTRFEISTDPFHREYNPVERTANVIRAAKEQGIEVILRTMTTRRYPLADSLAGFDSTLLANALIVNSRCVPVGRGSTEVPREEVYTVPGLPVGSCSECLNLAIRPHGWVFPCCAGADICPPLSLGNAQEKSLRRILDRTRGNFTLQMLVHAGPQYFVPAIQSAGLGDRLHEGYVNICELCVQIFGDPALTAGVQAFMRQREAQCFEKLMAA